MTSAAALLPLWILLAHLAGDYVLQSNWMAQLKTSRWIPAIAHAAVYTLAYVPITRSLAALAFIGGTHLVIDRFRLARHLCWAKERLSPRSWWRSWSESSATGYAPETPVWLATWLMILADNTVHLAINAAAILWLT